ncbi:MAG TPA: hypothetical protein VIB08_06380 [Thermoanaerobaculia bacterium]|jgi:hypothetical protein
MTSRLARIAALWLASPVFCAAAAAAEEYEKPPELEAKEFLPQTVLKTADYEVQPKVQNDGFFNTYTIVTAPTTFETTGTSLVEIRIVEINALVRLRDMDKAAVAAGGVATSIFRMGTGTFHLLTNPVGTAQGLGDGAKRFFDRLGRGARRTVEKVDAPSEASGSGASTASKVADASGGAAMDLLGVNRSMRAWARKLGVDPYTRNPVLRKALQEVAAYDAGGQLATKFLPLGAVGTALGAATTVNTLVWDKDPDELVTWIEQRLDAMGMTLSESQGFRLNPNYGLTRQTEIVGALDGMPGVEGRPGFIREAGLARDEAEAQFFLESALMMADRHREKADLFRIIPEAPGACVTTRSGAAACFFPLDYVAWTQGVAEQADRIAKAIPGSIPKEKREVLLTGKVSERTRRELARRSGSLRTDTPVVPLPAPGTTAATR